VAESPKTRDGGVAELEPDRRPAGGGAWLRRRSTLWALAVAVVAAVAIVVNVVLLTNNGTSSVTAASVVLAGQLSAQQPGFGYAMTSSTTVEGQHILLTASGKFDEAAPISGSTTVTVQGRTFKERLVDTDIYIQSPTSSKSWYRVNYHSLLHALGPSAPLETNSDPADWLTTLQGATQVTDLGIEKIRGVPTTHYNALVDLDKLAQAVPADERVAAAADAKLLERLTGQSSFTADVWVDVANLVRQLEISLPVKTAAGTVVELLSMQMFDYGLQPQAQAPPAKDVTDLRGAVTSKIAQQLQALTS
jgi:hypothetical protein